MAVANARRNYYRRHLPRPWIFRENTHPFEELNDLELFDRHCFPRLKMVDLMAELQDQIKVHPRRGYLTPLLQILLTLRFYATRGFKTSLAKLLLIIGMLSLM